MTPAWTEEAMEATAGKTKLRPLDRATLLRWLNGGSIPAHLAADDPSSAILLERLMDGQLWAPAARLLAHALPEREATWWACMCVAATAPQARSGELLQAAVAAEAWVRRPSEAARRGASEAARNGSAAEPEIWAARAAALAGVAAAPDRSLHAGHAADAAVALAADRGDPGRRVERVRRFIDSGRDIAAGGSGRLASEAAWPS